MTKATTCKPKSMSRNIGHLPVITNSMESIQQLNFDSFKQQQRERKAAFDKKHSGKKIDHSYQELAIEMQQFFGKNIWYLFWKYKEQDIKEAFEICKRKEIKNVAYLIGCINRKYTGF